MKLNNTKIIHSALLLVSILLSACGGGNGTSATTITAQPSDQNVVVGTAATFTVAASNATGYQWQRSSDGGITFTGVNGATTASHTTPVTTLADSGTLYRVVVTSASNSVTSSAVTLTVTAAPVAPGITVHPAGQTITEGQNASFSVTASGTSLSYQWQRSTDGGVSFADVAAATSATLSLTSVPLADNAYQFRVVVSNSAGSVTSNAATLTVNAAQAIPAFTTQPASLTVLVPNTATFNVVATGSPSPTLQWQLSTNAGSSFANIAGATASSYTTAATVTGDNGNQYRVVATNTSGATSSTVATLTVNLPAAAPVFTTQPANVTIVAGQNAQMTVAVTGVPTPTLQWQLSTDSGSNWSNIVGATGSVFNMTAVALANNGRQFRAVATNGSGVTNSNAATLTVNAAQAIPAFTTQPANVSIVEGQNAQMSVAVSGTPAPTLQWQLSTDSGVSWSNIVGATGSVFSMTAVALTNNGRQFRAVATNSAGAVNSNAAILTVTAASPAPNGWQTETLIENNDLGEAIGPQVAINAAGDGMAVWYQFDGTRYDIWASRYGALTGWEVPTLIEADVGDAGVPQVAVDVGGNATAVWQQRDVNGRNNVWANRYVAGAGWGTPVAIETNGPAAGDDQLPQIAMDAGGNVIAVWELNSFSSTSIWANRYSGGSWGTAVQIGSGNASVNHVRPQIAVDAAGNGFAVWPQYNGSITNIWGNRFVAGTGWGTAALIQSNSTNSGRDPKVAADANGNAMLVWAEFDLTTSTDHIWANRYAAGTGWGTATLIQTGNATYQSSRPSIAFDATGNAIAAWTQLLSNSSNVYAARFVAGTGWAAETPIETHASGSSVTNVSIGMDTSGNALVVWQQIDASLFMDIRANRYTVGTGWGTATQIEPSNVSKGQALTPQIAMNAGGAAIAVWQRRNPTRFDIWANVYK